MNVQRIAWIGVSTLAIASWFAGASTSGVRTPVVPLPPPKPAAVDRSMAALESEIGRLHERIAPTQAPTRTRDLFRFSSPRAPKRPVAASATRPAVTESAPAVAPRPALTLIGIAEDAAPDGIVRTAIVSGLGDVFLVKPGETIRDRYRVGQVSADAVQLIDTTTDVSTTLALH